jgi:peroxiredoxin (alkyl hydroperoxide reductase subunit C)
MAIRIGRPAPDFAAEAYVPGQPEPYALALEHYHGAWVVLFFYPRDFTFVCPTELHAFGDLAEDFAAEDALLVAASTDSYWTHKAWFESHPLLANIEYPILADTSHAVSSRYDVLLEDGSALRATYVIDPEGIVRHASVSDQNVGRSPAETLRVLQALRTGSLCPVDWRKGEPTLKAA